MNGTPTMAVLGAGVGLGLFLIIASVTGNLTAPHPKLASQMGTARIDRLTLRVSLAVVLALGAALGTGWIAATLAGAVVGWWTPSLIGVRAARARQGARAEAVASWCEMLRDTLAAADGLREAIAATSRVAPEAIAEEIRSFNTRAERGSLSNALRAFAVEVDDPVADTVVVALLAASERQGRNLGEMLSAVAASARQAAAMQLRLSAARARTFRSAQLVCGISGAFILAMVVWNRDYMAPFDTAPGQGVLIVALGLMVLAGWGLLALSKPTTAPRLLITAATGRPTSDSAHSTLVQGVRR